MNATLRICLVLDCTFGARLEPLARVAPVWAVASEQNQMAAVQLWEAGVTDLTTFREQGFADILPTIDQHHLGWRELEVFGDGPSETVLAALEEFGPGELTPTPEGFIFVRRNFQS